MTEFERFVEDAWYNLKDNWFELIIRVSIGSIFIFGMLLCLAGLVDIVNFVSQSYDSSYTTAVVRTNSKTNYDRTDDSITFFFTNNEAFRIESYYDSVSPLLVIKEEDKVRINVCKGSLGGLNYYLNQYSSANNISSCNGYYMRKVSVY